ncbi:MAG TPA: hypothetical protein VGW10_05275 [Solirubrobacteraceae bacterium]|nr:hypothetical protein [Solirubrobacteraceae bacterium]
MPLRLLLAALAATLLATAVPAAVSASADSASSSANAAAKRCSGGKVLVRRPGRSSVCAKPCPSGTKRKVSRRGKLSCVRKRTPAPSPQSPEPGAPPAGGPPAPSGTEPAQPAQPAPSGPAAGTYSGTTEQQRPVGFTVEGSEVKNFEAGVNTWCTTMYNNRVVFDAIANVPPMAIGPDGSFSYTGDETNGNMKITGRITGTTATGTVGMMRGDTNYSGGQMYYGQCSASDVPWSATLG